MDGTPLMGGGTGVLKFNVILLVTLSALFKKILSIWFHTKIYNIPVCEKMYLHWGLTSCNRETGNASSAIQNVVTLQTQI